VFLSERDLSRLAGRLKVDYSAFVDAWCRWVPYVPGRERLSLREKPNLDCVLWGLEGSDGCSVYDARPLQCEAFPFWDSILCSKEAWEKMSRECPGMNSGRLRPRAEIEGFLRRQDDELIIERRVPSGPRPLES